MLFSSLDNGAAAVIGNHLIRKSPRDRDRLKTATRSQTAASTHGSITRKRGIDVSCASTLLSVRKKDGVSVGWLHMLRNAIPTRRCAQMSAIGRAVVSVSTEHRLGRCGLSYDAKHPARSTTFLFDGRIACFYCRFCYREKPGRRLRGILKSLWKCSTSTRHEIRERCLASRVIQWEICRAVRMS